MNYEQFITEVFHLSNPKLITDLAKSASLYSAKKGEKILDINQEQQTVNILKSGVFRIYYFDEGGREYTDCFLSRKGMLVNVLSAASLMKVCIEALTNAELVRVPISVVRNCWCPELSMHYFVALHSALAMEWKERSVIQNMSVPERFKWFQSVDPVSCEAATARQLATYLGTTRETITRLKNSDLSDVEVFDFPADRDGCSDYMSKFYELINHMWKLDKTFE